MPKQAVEKKGFSGKQVLLIVLGVMLLTVIVTILVVKIWLFPSPFTPVTLDKAEEQQLEQKMERLDSFTPVVVGNESTLPAGSGTTPVEKDFDDKGNLNPATYSETGASREISFTEREINGLLANNTDLAQKMAFDLADDLISLRLLLPIDPDFPFMGGKIIRARAGAELAYREGKPVVILKGVSLMGIPVPNAWLGGLKNIDLVREFGGDQGFWQSFSEGVEHIRIREGELYIKLKE